MAILRASVVQACTAAFSLPDTLAKLKQYAKTAKDEGAQLVVFPEAFIGGYPKMELFGNAEEFVHYYQAAIDLPSPALTEIEATAKELGIFIVAGVIERDLGTLYCTAIFVDPVEGFVAKHRKTVPTTVERLVWGRGGPDTLPVVEKQFQATAAANGEAGDSVKVKISATICWENYMPLLRTFYYSKGTQIYCAPTVDDAEGWQHTMHHISLEGRCFVLAACQFAKEKDYPARGVDDASRDLEKVRLAGGSVIISPQGKVLAGPLRDQEGVLTADLDLEDIVRGKYKMDSVGHYSRPDIFKLQTLDVKEY